MILQALNDYYRRSADLPREGWVRRGVDYLLVLDKEGKCINMECIQDQEKGRPIAHQMLVPSIGKQAMKHNNSGKDANLLWDNGSFVLGGEGKGAVKVGAFVNALEQWLEGVSDEGLSAVLAFAKSVQTRPETRNEVLSKFGLKELFDERDYIIAFKLHGDVEPLHNRPAIRGAYERKMTAPVADGQVLGNCLVTGAIQVPIALNETVIKGIFREQTSGVNLVSFNARSFDSYGKRKGANAPVSLAASFAYTTALKGLLSSSKQKLQIADATTVFWAEEQHELEGLFGDILRDDPERGTQALQALLKAATTGKFNLGSNTGKFHVTGLGAPAKSRVSVRFYVCAPAEKIAGHLVQHFKDLELKSSSDGPQYLSISRILKAVSRKSNSRKAIDGYDIQPRLSGEVMDAVVKAQPYPTTLLNMAVLRCRAEQANRDKQAWQNVPMARAAVIKACLNRSIRTYNQNTAEPETQFTPMLDPTNPSHAYRLGRLFATFEKVQEEANRLDGRLNATIRDKYYGAASSTPGAVFSTLIRLNKHHLSKLGKESRGLSVVREKLIQEIANGLNDFPTHLTLPDQGRFALGYYHQRQALFTSPDKPTEPANN
ncbi:MAG: type I-C CRISPR-associated protein Cas8c/Csd1 [Flavobacteriales bacterium]|nr:type I-C CRISPR-associated protein Cas8c/Csd1 [Flavobacteriales bacterium]